MMWHFRFGHLHFGGLTELVKKEMVFGLPSMEFEKIFCEDCVIGKHARTSFPRNSEYQAKEQLGLVHTDLCGPITPESFSGKRFFVSFIDNFSRKTCVYFLKEKAEVFEIFKKFRALVEKETGKVIKAFQFDRGGEFTSAMFARYYEEHGVRQFLTAPYSPQQNGVTERKNRTILDMVRSMFKSKSLPKKFWAEAVQCAVYVQNRCPHAKLGEKTPQEVWNGKKPSVSHLKVFGSVAYGQVPNQQRTKLEDQSKKYIFIGYDEKAKAYKLFDPVNQKLVVSRDVHVEESKTWNWSNSIEEETSSEVVMPPISTTTELSKDESEPQQPRIRSLQEIYNTTNEVHVVCLLADSEDLNFEKAVQDEKWKLAMDEEIGAIERNKTWELTNLS
uniref:Retrovirus-related Pol polyprotein from transposon TNT 1-94 n=1 Tax=Cajanus cajan TaxID=3821 RepID=A0A151QNM0_CAJCA|nr:Retrovirus-related Pol polyprotein from transposon TNT 1-94 [Cajanus cajan]